MKDFGVWLSLVTGTQMTCYVALDGLLSAATAVQTLLGGQPEDRPARAGRRGGRTTERSEGVSGFGVTGGRGGCFRGIVTLPLIIGMQGCVDLQPSPNHWTGCRIPCLTPSAAEDRSGVSC